MFSYFYITNICVIIIFVCLFFVTRKTNKRWSKINDYLGKVTTTVDSVRYGDLTTKLEKIDHPTYQNVTDSINRMVETLNDREKMIVEYQSELMNQNRLLESVINSLSDGILIINDKFEILRATPKILKWFGVKRGKDIIGKNVFEFIQFSQDQTDVENIANMEVFIKHSSTKSFVINSAPLTSVEKKRYVLIIKDITTEKEIATLKEDFVATLTHDLKVPIIAAANMIDLFLGRKFGEISDKQEFALDNMRASNQELLNLVQILLETYKISEKGIELKKEQVFLNPFIQSIINEMTPIAHDADMEINFEASTDNPKILADPTQLQRVVKNLISNAINHSHTEKAIEVAINSIPDYITISVTDFGQGISKDELRLVFNKYYSVAKKLRKVGTGLGLYLSQQIAQAHGGEITVESKEHVKTEFCIKLPKA
ncbi:PAS domain-containing sensor histidine kinase [bacterium]|nr:PAS domain-containing sensor histidine kinase [bacterium]